MAPVAVAALPATAQAAWEPTHIAGPQCLTESTGWWGPDRTPKGITASGSAFKNCAHQNSLGWMSARIFETYNNQSIARNLDDGFVEAKKYSLNNTLQVRARLDHLGYHHSHIVSFYSSRNP